jgi:hypothetical protein
MLSMINPDSLTRFESQAKFSTTNIHHGVPVIQETYFEQHGEAEKHTKATKSTLLHFP